MTLKNLPVNQILEKAIKKAVDATVAAYDYRLSHQDVFYREVTKIHRAIKELASGCEEAAHSDLNPKDVATLISDTNDVILVIHTCCFCGFCN